MAIQLLSVFIVFVAVFTHCTGHTKWEHDTLGPCSFMFARSARERHQHEQRDPLVLWLGIPSRALKVKAKHGLLPLPTVWGSYANILYMHCSFEDLHRPVYQSTHDTMRAAALKEMNSLMSWLDGRASLLDRQLFLAGNARDESGGNLILQFAITILRHNRDRLRTGLRPVALSGIAVGDLPFTPTPMFFGFRSFETANKLNFWTIDRAKKPIVCNSLWSEVEFVMNDVHLVYVPTTPIESSLPSSEMFEYQLYSVSTYDLCYRDIAAFEKEYSQRPPLLTEALHPALPAVSLQLEHTVDSGKSSAPFPPCDSEHLPSPGPTSPEPESAVSEMLGSLLASNVSLLMYSTIRKSPKPTCSFYIGIYEADGMRLPVSDSSPDDSPVTSAVHRFNDATLQSMAPSWSTGTISDSSILTTEVPGMFQSGMFQSEFSGDELGQESEGREEQEGGGAASHAGNLHWMHFESAAASTGTSQSPSTAVLSKSGAVDILARLLQSHSEVDFMELLVMSDVLSEIRK